MRMPRTKKRRTQILETLPTQEGLLPVSRRELPAASDSVALDDILDTDADRLGWANSVRYHVSRQLLLLRKAQGLRQKQVADAAGTSQSAIARIESGEENITLDTVERLINGMEGLFQVVITPARRAGQRQSDWWKPAQSSTAEWHAVFTAVHQDGNYAVVALKRDGTVPLIIDDQRVA
jgi:transcriptional regulator with XRE-family HTH domain